jgi:hypothetical protein
MKRMMNNMRYPIDADRLLGITGIIYIAVAAIGALVSIAGDMPAEFMGHEPTTTVIKDFLLPWGWGTGMSPPLILMIVVATLVALLLSRRGYLVLWRLILTIGGLLFALGQLGEPHTYNILSGGQDFTPLRACIVVAMVAVPLAMSAAGVRALSARSHKP